MIYRISTPQRACLTNHTSCKFEFQSFNRSHSQLTSSIVLINHTQTKFDPAMKTKTCRQRPAPMSSWLVLMIAEFKLTTSLVATRSHMIVDRASRSLVVLSAARRQQCKCWCDPRPCLRLLWIFCSFLASCQTVWPWPWIELDQATFCHVLLSESSGISRNCRVRHARCYVTTVSHLLRLQVSYGVLRRNAQMRLCGWSYGRRDVR